MMGAPSRIAVTATAAPPPRRSVVRLAGLVAATGPLCGDRLTPIPADTEHDGWTCGQPQGHLAWSDHRAEDGTTW